MEQHPGKKEYIPQFEIKIGVDTTENAVKSKFLDGRNIAFFGTRNFDVYLSDLGHDEMRFKSGVDREDIIDRGYVFQENGRMTIHHYSWDTKADLQHGIDQALKRFLQE